MNEPGLWQRIVAKIQSRTDRITHTWSRRQAGARVRQRVRPARVTMICYGNICRSPYAEAALRRRLLLDGIPNVQVDSAGFFGPDRPANQQASAIAGTRGLDLSGHRSQLVASGKVHADLLLVMTRGHRDQLMREFGVPSDRIELLGDFDIADPPYREIEDPYGRPDAEFTRVFAQIERSIEGLCAHWADQGAEQSGSEAGATR